MPENNETKYRTATVMRKWVPQLLYTMSGTPGITIFNREHNTVIYSAVDETAQEMLELYISNHLLLEGNVTFGE